MKSGRVRRLALADADEVLRIVDLEGFDATTLVQELESEDDYLWMGLESTNGGLGAVHRSMRWGNHLLLKGVFVEQSMRGSGAALELAFALRDAARCNAYAGIAAWVEPHKPEGGLARMLRLQATGPFVHRFEVFLPGDGSAKAASGVGSGTLSLSLPDLERSAPLVADMLSGASPAAVRWVLDRHRLVLSGFPLCSVADLHVLTSAAGPVARARGAGSLEFPVPAADLSAALSLASVKARRLSRTPVLLGRLDFSANRADTARGGRRQDANDAA